MDAAELETIIYLLEVEADQKVSRQQRKIHHVREEIDVYISSKTLKTMMRNFHRVEKLKCGNERHIKKDCRVKTKGNILEVLTFETKKTWSH